MATFSDDAPASTPADYRATIDWGDGHTTLGVIAAAAGGFAVTGTNTYQSAGSPPVRVTILDVAGGSQTVATGVANVVSTAGSASGQVIAPSPTEGQPSASTVATFTPADASLAPGSFQASIDWGDGQVTPGAISGTAGGPFNVTGVHAYAEEGTFPVIAAIRGTGGLLLTAVGRANVGDAPLSITPTTVRPAASTLFTGVVATFLDSDPGGQAGDYRAVISWGDGQVGEGTITPNASGGFDISGSNTYGAQKSDALTVQVFDAGGSTATTTSTALVGGPVLPLTGQLGPGSDAGPSSTDDITNVNRPTFVGTATPFAVVQVFALAAGAGGISAEDAGPIGRGP